MFIHFQVPAACFFKGVQCTWLWCASSCFPITFPEADIAPENMSFQKEIHLPIIHFQGLWLLVSGREFDDFDTLGFLAHGPRAASEGLVLPGTPNNHL